MLLSDDCLIIPSEKNLHKGYNGDTLYWVVVFGASDTTGHSMGDGSNFCGFLKLPVTKELLEFTYLIWEFTIFNYFSEFKSIHTLPWHPLRPYNYCLECYWTKHFMSIYNGPYTRIFQQDSSNFKVFYFAHSWFQIKQFAGFTCRHGNTCVHGHLPARHSHNVYIDDRHQRCSWNQNVNLT